MSQVHSTLVESSPSSPNGISPSLVASGAGCRWHAYSVPALSRWRLVFRAALLARFVTRFAAFLAARSRDATSRSGEVLAASFWETSLSYISHPIGASLAQDSGATMRAGSTR